MDAFIRLCGPFTLGLAIAYHFPECAGAWGCGFIGGSAVCAIWLWRKDRKRAKLATLTLRTGYNSYINNDGYANPQSL